MILRVHDIDRDILIRICAEIYDIFTIFFHFLAVRELLAISYTVKIRISEHIFVFLCCLEFCWGVEIFLGTVEVFCCNTRMLPESRVPSVSCRATNFCTHSLR